MKPRELGVLVVLAGLWGGSYLFIRVAARALGPFALVEGRMLLAAAVLLLGGLAVRRPPPLHRFWRRLLVLGLINSVIPFTLISAAELHLTASMGAILNATTPLFAALVAAAWLSERLTARRVAGLLVGLAGVGVAVGWSSIPFDRETVLSVAASLAAALSYSCGAAYSRARLQGASLLTLAAGQQAAGAVILFPVAAVTLPDHTPSAKVVGAVVALGIACTAVAYLLYFHLIRVAGPTRTLSVTFLVPVFGLLWGALFLDEPLSAGLFGGFALIVVGLLLVTDVRLPVRVPQPGSAAGDLTG